MKSSFLDTVLRGAEALAARDPVGSLPDADLLKRFTAEREASAFAVLLRRHGPLVWGICRNLLPGDGDAEDAFQATFLALVKSPGSVQRPEALGGWLHGVAYRVALKARRSAARRKLREGAAANGDGDYPVADSAWDALQAAVHEEVCRLPEKLRLPFVLVGLQGRPQKEAARQLGLKVGTFSARLCQARQRLLDRLAKRGVPAGMAAGATVLGAASISAAAPVQLVAKAVEMVTAPDVVTPFVDSLSRGVMSMYLTRTKLLVAGVLIAGALTTGIGSRLLSTAEAQTPAIQERVDAELAYKRALERLQALEARDPWEYKFIPTTKAPTADELQALLRKHGTDGWDYCGSQDLAVSGKATPHLTFKRANTHKAAAIERERIINELLKAQWGAPQVDPEARDKRAANLADLEKYYQRAAEAQIEALRQKAAGNAANARATDEARLRVELELKRAMDAEDRARAEAELANAARRAALAERDRVAELRKQLEALQAEHAALMEKLKNAEPRKPAEKKPDANDEVHRIPLKYISAADAQQILAKTAPGVKLVGIDERTNSLIIAGSHDVADNITQLVAKMVDLEPKKPDTLVAQLSLQGLSVAAIDNLAATLAKSVPAVQVVAQGRKDMIALTGPPAAIDQAKAVIAQLSRANDLKLTPAELLDIAFVPLKHIDPKKLLDGHVKEFEALGVKCTAEPSSNALLLAGVKDAVARAKKRIGDIDAAAGRGK